MCVEANQHQSRAQCEPAGRRHTVSAVRVRVRVSAGVGYLINETFEDSERARHDCLGIRGTAVHARDRHDSLWRQGMRGVGWESRDKRGSERRSDGEGVGLNLVELLRECVVHVGAELGHTQRIPPGKASDGALDMTATQTHGTHLDRISCADLVGILVNSSCDT